MKAAAVLILLLILPAEHVAAQHVDATSAATPLVADAELNRIRGLVRSFGPQASAPAQLLQLVRDLPPATAAQLHRELAEDFLSHGHWDLGASVLLQILDRYPDEPAASQATLTLVRLYSSSELAHTQRQTRSAAAQLRLPPGWVAQSTASPQAHPMAGFAHYALFLANGQLNLHPELAELAPLAFQCTVAARHSGDSPQHNSWLSLVKHKRDDAGWRERGLAESWLKEGRKSEPPLAITHCVLAAAPPHLDGALDEPYWQSALQKSETQSLLAYDAEYLYLAIRCRKRAEADYSPDNNARTYDADLHEHDRVCLWLDADRDYATWFQLTLDHRGWTGDRCWLDADWNPKWFVAAAADGEAWTCEAAIPWSELTSTPPRAGQAWACAVERISPAANSPTEPAAPACELLLFD